MADKPVYDAETIKRINDSADLLEYVSETILLHRRGENYFAHCPRHTDRTPSLCISPARNTFKCFSCGCGGGLVSYLRYIEGYSFHDAVGKAMRITGVDASKLMYCSDCVSKYIKETPITL